MPVEHVYTRLFIGNLSRSCVTANEIRDVFQRYGEVKEVSLHDQFAFVQYDNVDSATAALEAENGKQLGRRRMDVQYAKKQKSRASKGRGVDEEAAEHFRDSRGHGPGAPHERQTERYPDRHTERHTDRRTPPRPFPSPYPPYLGSDGHTYEHAYEGASRASERPGDVIPGRRGRGPSLSPGPSRPKGSSRYNHAPEGGQAMPYSDWQAGGDRPMEAGPSHSNAAHGLLPTPHSNPGIPSMPNMPNVPNMPNMSPTVSHSRPACVVMSLNPEQRMYAEMVGRRLNEMGVPTDVQCLGPQSVTEEIESMRRAGLPFAVTIAPTNERSGTASVYLLCQPGSKGQHHLPLSTALEVLANAAMTLRQSERQPTGQKREREREMPWPYSPEHHPIKLPRQEPINAGPPSPPSGHYSQSQHFPYNGETEYRQYGDVNGSPPRHSIGPARHSPRDGPWPGQSPPRHKARGESHRDYRAWHDNGPINDRPSVMSPQMGKGDLATFPTGVPQPPPATPRANERAAGPPPPKPPSEVKVVTNAMHDNQTNLARPMVAMGPPSNSTNLMAGMLPPSTASSFAGRPVPVPSMATNQTSTSLMAHQKTSQGLIGRQSQPMAQSATQFTAQPMTQPSAQSATHPSVIHTPQIQKALSDLLAVMATNPKMFNK